MTTIFVGNLSFQTTEAEVSRAFSRYGRVSSVRVMTDRSSGSPRGFAFVMMPGMDDAEEAIARMNGQSLSGRNITVNERVHVTNPPMADRFQDRPEDPLCLMHFEPSFFLRRVLMVTVTPTAIQRLHGKLRNQPEGTAVRMTVSNGHVKFRPSTEQKGDVVFAHQGQSVLLLAAATARRISRRTLDVVVTAAGNRLRFVPSV